MQTSQRWLALLVGAFAIAAAAGGVERALAQAQAPTRAPDVHYQPTPHRVVTEMLKVAQVGANDVLYDLGCGDGRIVIAAVKQRGARGVCVDIDPQRIRESRANAERAGVAERIAFLEQDLFETDLRDATVVTLFLSPDLNLKLRPKLQRVLKPGTRVISYVHSMGDWKPQTVKRVKGASGPRKLYLWTIAADRGARP
ncbi:MAG TPA: class I SAM-dependent methyltransferase [Burkholderiales bacterium]|nr:class I SAM-dependent methyltransferase [Burkholderiales bacterium]